MSSHQFAKCPQNTLARALPASSLPLSCVQAEDLHPRTVVYRMELTPDTWFIHFWEQFCASPSYLTQYCPAA